MEPSPKKVCEEEKASGISVEELMEKESLIKELVERDDVIQAKAESALKQQLKDNETACNDHVNRKLSILDVR